MSREKLIPLLPLSALEEGEMRACRVGGLAVLVCRVDGEVFAVENRCSHAGSRLDAGRLRGHTISCPLHGARFDVRDGGPLAAPARRAIRTFDLVLEAGKIHVLVSDPTPPR